MIEKIRKEVMYHTSDGKYFSEEDAAIKHQVFLNILIWCKENGIGKGGEWTAEMVADVIHKNRYSLIDLIGC